MATPVKQVGVRRETNETNEIYSFSRVAAHYLEFGKVDAYCERLEHSLLPL